MITVLFVRHTPEVKTAQVIDHDVKAGRTLIAKKHGSGRRLIGKQLTVPQKFGPTDDSRITESGENIVMQLGCARHMFDQPADHRALFERKGGINIFRLIIGCAPACSGVMGGDKSQPVNAGQRGELSAKGRLIKKITLPGPFTARPQAVLIHTRISQGIFNPVGTLPQDLIQLAVYGGTVDPGSERKHPAVIEAAESVAVTG